MTDYLAREITPRLLRALHHLPVVVLSGLRQTGKSTLFRRETALAEGRAYRTLDDFATLAAARANPEALLEHDATLDEVQRCPELPVALEKSVDERRQPGRDDLMRGALYETYVAQSLATLLGAHEPDAQLAYWHEQGRHEVDFVIESGRSLFAIQVKAGTRWSEGDLSGLRAFVNRTPGCTAAVPAYNGREAVKLEDKLWAIPLGHLPA